MKIIISPPFGAGWTTWMHDIESMEDDFWALTYQPLIAALETGSDEELAQAYHSFAEEYEQRTGEPFYSPIVGRNGGLDRLRADLAVCTVPEGKVFRVSEYDGSERVEYLNIDNWHSS